MLSGSLTKAVTATTQLLTLSVTVMLYDPPSKPVAVLFDEPATAGDQLYV